MRSRSIIKECIRMAVFVGLLLALISCHDDSDSNRPQTQWTDYTVAVILPQKDGMQQRWQRTADWMTKNLEQAQESQEQGVRLKIEWYDENSADLESLGRSLAKRTDVMSIIGLSEASHLNTVCSAINEANTRKTVFSTHTGSEEIIHRYAAKGFLWTLNETDVTQCELMLLDAIKQGNKKVSLLTPDNDYGKTFYDYFAFEANEMNLKVGQTLQYTSANRDQYFQEAILSNDDAVLCTMNSEEDIKAFLLQQAKDSTDFKDYIFSSAAFQPAILKILPENTFIEGIGLVADPSSGFDMAYQARFSEESITGEAQLYDALMLTAFSIIDCQAHGADVTAAETINHSLQRQLVTATDDGNISVWDEVGMEQHIRQLSANTNTYYIIRGAIGKLRFDTEGMGTLVQSTYCKLFCVGKYTFITEYISSKGTNRISSAVASWQWKKTYDELKESQTKFNYPELQEKYAVLVAPVDAKDEYRFQADVLYMYQTLKAKGMDDDHIILILNDENLTEGNVIEHVGGEDLWHDVEIDYDPQELTPNDFVNIMKGNSTSRTRRVLTSGSNDNVLVYWASHGTAGRLPWLYNNSRYRGYSLSYLSLALMLEDMEETRNYRKMLWLTEACEAESVMQACEGINGVMAISAAKAGESSKGDQWSYARNTLLTNQFSHVLIDKISQQPNISFRDLYIALNSGVRSSHVVITNYELFDNLYNSSIEEFIGK